MNSFHIQHSNDFNIIINASILLTGTTNCEEEMHENMWVISLEETFISLNSREVLINFINALIQ